MRQIGKSINMKTSKHQKVIVFLLIVLFIQHTVEGQEFPFRIGSYYEKDSDSTKRDGLDLLAGFLIKSPNALGVVVLTHRKKENVGKRCRYLKNFLRKKGVGADRLLFIDGGIISESVTHLNVFDKNDKTLRNLKDFCQSQYSVK